MRISALIAAYFLGIISMVACAGVTYRYYGMEMPPECYEKSQLLGKLGKTGWPDISMAECKPTDAAKGKCWVSLSSDYFALTKDLDTCHQALKDCQAGAPPQP